MPLAESLLASAPFQQICVALDLETTGLDHTRDTILEVGAVKFQGDRVIDTYQTFINPGRAIPEFIQRLTGISPNQVRRAPFFASISADLAAFVGGHPIVGHNIAFDLRFLDSHGLGLGNTSYDTWDLASVFLPRGQEYSLVALSTLFGVAHAEAHRALGDAKATHGVFVALLAKAAEADPGLLAYLVSLAARSRWSIAPLLAGLAAQAGPGGQPSSVGLTGLDLEHLASRLGRPEKRRADGSVVLDEAKMLDLLGPAGPFARAFPGFEHRPEQTQMLAAVTQAMRKGQHLVVEGGTGVGKSMAYLLPAVLFAAAKGQRVVISTNTINLQEQLLRKDIPALVQVLEGAGLLPVGLVKAAPLKGRANYLCLRRWGHLARNESPTVDDARLLGKTGVWLQETTSGDRGELNLSGRDAFTWNRVSAGEKGWCPGLRDGGACFLRSARERAEQAHLVVVNHALLLSDMAHGGSLIPEHQYLIVDEAHNLEEEATRQFGFQVASNRMEEEMELQGRLLGAVRLALRAEGLASVVRQQGENSVSGVDSLVPRLRQLWGLLWGAAERFLEGQAAGGDDASQVLLTREVRGHRAWADVALAWENLDVVAGQAGQRLDALQKHLESTAGTAVAADRETLVMEAATAQDNLSQLRGQLGAILSAPDDHSIHWLAREGNNNEIVFHSAPLEVGSLLTKMLFAQKECAVLTSATLSTQGSFDYLRQRLGVPEDSQELLVGSPFDYQKAALLLIPDDMPQPQADGYSQALAQVLSGLSKSLGGHTMALFTSHASLRSVAQLVRAPLLAEGIQVLAQGVDGSPPQLIRRFSANPKSLLLGTSSFWEGVDLPAGVLKALVLTRLPFQVPTDPIVKARSDQYKDAFSEYSVPQAVLRFRQGIGRLIRRKGDKGTLVVLDRRVTGRSYGKAFLRSIPPCTMKPSVLATVGPLAAQWVSEAR
ncbi:MAG: DNA polymerase III subunit epsilon [Dehalococcoidia bacterium]|nr:DNA polymerase III subunit epsilon [Dehalococcoidia bacterium]MSQ17321.1 DNA polymerase III subunit epsilon [Dehalococcoidia bacterium]